MCEPVKESWDSFCPLDELQAVHIAVSAAHDHESTKPKCNANVAVTGATSRARFGGGFEAGIPGGWCSMLSGRPH